MNFSFDSVKLKSKLRNEDFYFDIETPRGHFFAVLDFASHDYANLNATLKGKLETIVGSFASLSDFTNELFLGFLVKETNNFVSNLAEQSGGPDLYFSAALCLLSGRRLDYFRCGELRITVLGDEGLLPLEAEASPAQLGVHSLEAPPVDQVQSHMLQDPDVVLIMSGGVAGVLAAQQVSSLRQSDPALICESLMKASEGGDEDRTLVVITGPYGPSAAELADLSALGDLKTSLTSFEAKLAALTEVSQQIEILRDDLRSKAQAIDVLELNEKLKGLSGLLASKADTADVMGLQRDVLKLGLASSSLASPNSDETTEQVVAVVASPQAPAEVTQNSRDTIPVPGLPAPSGIPFNVRAAIMVVAISLVAGFLGGWLQSRTTRKGAEVWSVKSSGNQIAISRMDAPYQGSVTVNLAEPVTSTGEQTFSSFADVKQYIDTVTRSAAPVGQTTPGDQPTPVTGNQLPAGVSEITIKPGDSLKRLAQVYNVPAEKLMELNPTITRWPAIRIGQKVFVPTGGSPASPSPSPQPEPSPASQPPTDTTEVRVGPGDSLNQLARRFNTTAGRLKELNPRITNWTRIQSGQRVVVPAPAG